ncbi:MAG: signal peptidase I, partial [Armatimonadota bacterium]|nr:signal peptidase I [Armatimonadota bacterium]
MVEVEHSEPEQRRKSLLLTRVTPGTALLVIGAIVVLRMWVVETAYVEGRSMQDTLQQGDRVLILKPLKRERFDVVVVDDPEEGGIDIKRIVGMPGDIVSMVPHVVSADRTTVMYGSQLYLNSQPYDEPYATSVIPFSLPPMKVPKESYFVMGDNRDDSIDSRRYGPVKKEHVRGVALAVVFPINRFQILTDVGASAA